MLWVGGAPLPQSVRKGCSLLPNPARQQLYLLGASPWSAEMDAVQGSWPGTAPSRKDSASHRTPIWVPCRLVGER